MPLEFGLLAQLLVLLAIAAVVVPLVRGAGRASWPSAVTAALVLYFGTTLAYAYLSDWHWNKAPPVNAQSAKSAQNMPDIATLQAAAQAQPENAQLQAHLGTALMNAGRAAEAVAPLERAQSLTGGSNADLTLALVDALMSSGDGNRERVNQMVERLLGLAPDHPKALLYGAELAFSRQEYDLAKARWQRLLDRALQEDNEEARSVGTVLRNRIAAADEQLGAAGQQPVSADTPGVTVAPAAGIVVEIELAPELANRVAAGSPLFVLAREPGVRGPPVAVVRRSAADLPLQVTLSDSDAMLPTRVLSGFANVEIVARIAQSGTPMAQAGDLFGAVTVDTRRATPVRVVVDEVYP